MPFGSGKVGSHITVCSQTMDVRPRSDTSPSAWLQPRLDSPSSLGTASPEDISDLFDQRVELLSACLEAVEGKFQSLTGHVAGAEDNLMQCSARLVHSEELVSRLRCENESARDKQHLLYKEVGRLEAKLETQRLQSSFSELKLQQQLAEERLRSERARAHRDEALLERNEALAELASAYADMEVMQTALSDSAFYVRYLRKKVLETEAQTAVLQQQAALRTSRNSDSGALSFASVRASVDRAVYEAARCEEEERKKRLRQLQLRWHPDKNPVLTSIATEVTKMINEAITEHCGASSKAD